MPWKFGEQVEEEPAAKVKGRGSKGPFDDFSKLMDEIASGWDNSRCIM